MSLPCADAGELRATQLHALPLGSSPTARLFPLTKGQVVTIDADQEDVLTTGTRWVASWSGRKYYAVRGRGPTRVYLHRVIAGAAKGQVVDHINGDTLDNRRANLRICTQQQNTFNGRPRGGVSGFKGVARHHDGKRWIARLTHNGKNLYLGIFDLAADAAAAYDAKAVELFGAFARGNNA